jgi:hypothetical protein
MRIFGHKKIQNIDPMSVMIVNDGLRLRHMAQ